MLGLLIFIMGNLTGCSDSDDDDDDDDDNDNDDNDTGDDDNDDEFNLSDPLGEGEVRAGEITAENELIGGPRARAEIGDYKIYNSQIEIIVRSPHKPGVSWGTYPGNIIDVDRARLPDEPGQDNLLGIDHIVGLVRSFWPLDIEVISDGADGVGILRVTGKDGGNQFISSLVSGGLPLIKHDYGLLIQNDYILEPDRDYITIRTTVTNEKDYRRLVPIADLPIWTYETDSYMPRSGFDFGGVDLGAIVRWIGAMNTHGTDVSYGLASSDSEQKIYMPYPYALVNIIVETLLPIEPLGQNSHERILIVGDGDARLIYQTLNEYDQNMNFGLLEGALTMAEKGDYSNTRILVMDDREEGSNHVAMLRPAADGTFSCQLEPGAYSLIAQMEGSLDSEEKPFSITFAETTNVAVNLDAPGYLDFEITDGAGGDVPCKITLQNGHDADPNSGQVFRYFSVSGQETIKVKPGSYTVTASRGFEYEIRQINATILPGIGNVVSFAGAIEHSVPTPGWISSDFHMHNIFSSDATPRPVTRVKQLAAEGLEMPVISEHDNIVDYDDFLIEAEAWDWVLPVTGSEISSGIGHFNAWPLTARSDRSDYYGLPFILFDDEKEFIRHYEHPEMWEFARSDYGAEIIQVNHPGGWWEYVGYDRATGLSGVDPNRWGDDFDAIEAWNGENLLNYFSLLDQGFNVTMHGNSDSHSYGNLGHPRNLIAMLAGADEPQNAEIDDFIVNDLAHRAMVTNGPFIEYSIAGESIGGFVTDQTGLDVDLEVAVHAPIWMDVNYVKVISNRGQVVYQETIGAAGGTLRYEDTITLSVAADAWFVVEAGHTMAKLGPVYPGVGVFAITNPIWVDIDGNGRFDPPGILP